ncbi:MAG: heparinase II/III domain-containing protein [Planctomycetota bacterium]
MVGSWVSTVRPGVLRLALGCLFVLALWGCERLDGTRVSRALEPEEAAPAASEPASEAAPSSGASALSSEPERPTPVYVAMPISRTDPGFQVRELAVQALSSRSARVAWTTPHPADSEVRWGKSLGLEGTPVLEPEAVLSHCVLLDGLEPGGTYYCQAISKTPAGTLASSEVVEFATRPVERWSVRPDRPRILFNRDDLPRLQERIRTTHARQWTELVLACTSALSKPAADVASAATNHYYARALAFAGLLGGDARFQAKALEIALECARLGTSGGKMPVRNRLLAMTAVYDWNHATIADAPRKTLREAILAQAAYLESSCTDSEYVWGLSHGNRRPILLAVLALYGEIPDAAEKLSALVAAYRDGYLATWRHYAEEGGSLKGWWYTTWTLAMEVEFFSALKSATGIDWYASEPWFEELVGWYAAGIRADNTFLRAGDSYIERGLNYLDWIYALNVVHHFRSGRAKWLAEKVMEATGAWDLLLYYDILWNDPSVAPAAPSGSFSRRYRAPGMVVVRDSWEPDAVLATFRSAADYTAGHTHLDNNSFTVFCRGGLAIDSGVYDEFDSPHHRNYSTRTIAHNTILVFDPSEKFVLYGNEYANDGGQRWLARGLDVPSSVPPRVEEVLDPRNGYRAGGIVRYEDGEDYTYALGDAAPSYSRTKLRKFERHFLWLKRVAGTRRPAIVVFDEVESTRPEFAKTYLLHTQNLPEVRGNLVVAEQKGGVLEHLTLLPRSPRISVVGGDGREFVVGGTNYPTKVACRVSEEPGRYRVEISPSSANALDRFLHVLHAGLAGEAMPPAASLACEGFVGASVGDWIVLFSTRGFGAASVRYEVAGDGLRKHLVVGLLPGGTYDLFADGAFLVQVEASLDGILRFDTERAGTIELALASRTRPPAETGAPLARATP